MTLLPPSHSFGPVIAELSTGIEMCWLTKIKIFILWPFAKKKFVNSCFNLLENYFHEISYEGIFQNGLSPF
jgi:hypothetical protein